MTVGQGRAGASDAGAGTMRGVGLDSVLIVMASFVLSRVLYISLLGVRFNGDTFEYYWQFIDPLLLRTDLVRSVYYLHQQPPLFNLFVGILVKLFPEYHAIVFQVLYLAMGIALSLSLQALLVEMGVEVPVALLLVLIHTVSPTRVIYENWLFYNYPIALLMCSSALFLCRWLKYHDTRHAHGCFWVMATLALIRSFYSIYWFLAVFFLLTYGSRPYRRQLLRAAAVPFLIIALVAIKQYVLFGTPVAGGVYGGQNLAARVQRFVPEEERARLVKSQIVPRYFFLKTFGQYSRYRPFLPPPAPTGIPVLDRETKSNGTVNFNYDGYRALSDGYAEGFKQVIVRFPEMYLFSFAPTVKYFYPASDDGPAMGPNTSRGLGAVTRCYNLLFCGQISSWTVGWFLVIGFPALLLFGGAQAYGLFRSATRDRAVYGTLIYMLANVLHVTALTVGVSMYDFNRYRFEIDVFYVVLLGMAMTWIWRRAEAHRALCALRRLR